MTCQMVLAWTIQCLGRNDMGVSTKPIIAQSLRAGVSKVITVVAGTIMALAIGAGSASAEPITNPGLSFSSGGNLFSGFTCGFAASGATFPDFSCATDMEVSASGGAVTFNARGGSFEALSGGIVDIKLSYAVTNAAGISSMSESISNPIFKNIAGVNVTEIAYTDPAHLSMVGKSLLVCSFAYSDPCDTEDPPYEVFSYPDNPDFSDIPLSATYTTLYVTTEIYLAALFSDSGILAGPVSEFFFPPAAAAVPEPASLGVFCIGLFGLLRFRRRISPVAPVSP